MKQFRTSSRFEEGVVGATSIPVEAFQVPPGSPFRRYTTRPTTARAGRMYSPVCHNQFYNVDKRSWQNLKIIFGNFAAFQGTGDNPNRTYNF